MKISWLVVTLFLILSGLVADTHNAYAVDLNAGLSSKGSPEKPMFKFQETVFINYHDGGKLYDVLHDKNVTVSFSADSKNPSVQDLVNKINANLLQNLKSLTRVTDVTLDYNATLQGGDKSATVDYNLVVIPTITSYVMAKGFDGQTVLDAGWMGMSVAGPVDITTNKYGTIDINTPASLLQNLVPDAYLQIKGTQAEQVLDYSLIDSSAVLQSPVGDWQHLFDPAYIITETSSWGYNGTRVPITTYTIGESSIGKVTNPTEHIVNLSLDRDYQIHTLQHASSATVQVDGVAKLEMIGEQLAFSTTPTTTQPLPSSGLSIQVIYAMAGFGVVIAVGVLVWSNKKMKEVVTDVETGPVRYETRQHWADRFDGVRNKPEEERATKSAI